MSNPINEKGSMTVLLWNYLENRDIFLSFAGKMKKLVIIFTLLVALCCCTTEADRNRMRSGLDSINARNRNDQPFTVKDVEPYVQFFDDHGTPNDRLLAHYLLGRAYYEAGEAPMALECYQKAAECADTLDKDCDYAQLCRVYVQMGNVFYYQGLYRKQLEHTNISVKYALMGKDTLAALMNYEQCCYAYRELGEVDSAIMVIENVVPQYAHYGYHSDAAIALGGIISNLIDKGEYAKTRQYMNIYESESGLFDENGNINKGREVYYYLKGLLCLKEQKLDSAEYWFRKELSEGADKYNQNGGAHGLSMVFEQKQKLDSVAKYSLYAYAMSDSLYAQRATKDVERIQAMYDYSRHQKEAQVEREKAVNEKDKRQRIVALLFLVILVSAIVFYKMNADRKKKQEQYLHNIEQLEQTQYEVLLLRAHEDEYKELIAEKEKLLEGQKADMAVMRDHLKHHRAHTDQVIEESAIYQKMLKKQYGQKLSNEDLRECHKLVIGYLPELNNLLASKQYKLSHSDYNVCMLLRLGFKSKEISNMLDVSQGRVSQICTKALWEIFGEDEGGAMELIEKLHQFS